MLTLTMMTLVFTPSNMKLSVKPYSTWLAYNINDKAEIKNMIPEGTKISPIRIFKNDKPTCKIMFNIYDTESSFFKGKRLEVVTIVRKITYPYSYHFVVLDCFSDTLHWDPENGIQYPNGRGIFSKRGSNFKLFFRSSTEEYLKLDSSMKKKQSLHRNFAIDSNYVCFFRSSKNAIKLDFDENEVMKKVINLQPKFLHNNLWKYSKGKLTHCFLHPHVMNFEANQYTMT